VLAAVLGLLFAHFASFLAPAAAGAAVEESWAWVWNEAFWKEAPDAAPLATARVPWTLLGPVVALALITVTVGLTAPLAAHAIGRAGYRRGTPLWKGTLVDEWAAADRNRGAGE
jgi:formate hydrogenlyase subunit 3/multisubunit Na+/H+ antiporter MnhD subunit